MLLWAIDAWDAIGGVLFCTTGWAEAGITPPRPTRRTKLLGGTRIHWLLARPTPQIHFAPFEGANRYATKGEVVGLAKACPRLHLHTPGAKVLWLLF